jgi:hypothetical protein
MRVFIAVLACLALVACGGPDESLITSSATAAPALEAVPPPIPTQLDEQRPMPAEGLMWQVVWSQAAQEFQLVQAPVEERFFHPVDVSVPPPELPPAPCPDCR